MHIFRKSEEPRVDHHRRKTGVNTGYSPVSKLFVHDQAAGDMDDDRFIPTRASALM
jgi:ATP-dependent phosphoenolpyruvate carboxykinase